MNVYLNVTQTNLIKYYFFIYLIIYYELLFTHKNEGDSNCDILQNCIIQHYNAAFPEIDFLECYYN